MRDIKELGISNGLIIPYNSIKDNIYEFCGKQYTIEFLDI